MEKIVLFVGLGAIFLAVLLVIVALATASGRPAGPAQALADINLVYAPAAAGQETIGDRAMRPIVRLLSALGRVLTPNRTTEWMLRRLDYAGNPPNWPPQRVHEMQGVGFVVLGFVGWLLGAGWAWWQDVSVLGGAIVGLVLGALIGLGAPLFYVLDMGQRRQEQMRTLLPDALDMLTLCVEAGIGFDAALVHVVRGTRGPLGREIARALHEMQMGKQRADAMRSLAERTSVPELRTIATSVVQATELGIPIAEVLREQSRQMRIKRRQRAEDKARKVPVKVIFPLILCLLPALFIVIIGPGVLRIMDTLAR